MHTIADKTTGQIIGWQSSPIPSRPEHILVEGFADAERNEVDVSDPKKPVLRLKLQKV